MYKLALNRPILTLMFAFALVVFGTISFNRMPVSLFPNVDFPIVTVKTVMPGADPGSMESRITDKIEEALSGIEGVDTITSISSTGASIVTVKFLLARNIDEAANDVRDKLSTVILPMDAEKPIINKVDSGSGSVINLFVASNGVSANTMMEKVDKVIKPAIQRLSGVANVNIIGYRDREIHVVPEPFLLAKYGLSLMDVQRCLQNENVKISGGRLVNNKQEILIKTAADATKLEDLKALKIRDSIRLSDVAKVEDGLEEARTFANLNGKQGVVLEVQKISGSNTLEVINAVKKTYPELVKKVGQGYQLTLTNDTSRFIEASLEHVKFDLLYGSFLAVLVVFLFLRNTRATFISAISLPVSIIGTFGLMNAMGYSLDKMTLVGLTLAIGVLIDDAIVIIENIMKRVEHGEEPFLASLNGTREIAFTVLAISAMLLAVFVPVAFMGGIVGKFFNSFALTVSFAVIISYIVALSLMPSLSARVLSTKESRFYRATEPVFVAVENFYVKTLRIVLRFKWLTIIGTFALLIGSFKLAGFVGKEFLPIEDKSECEIYLEAPIDVSLEEMKRRALIVQSVIAKDKSVEYTAVSVGYDMAKSINKAMIYCKLIPKEQRKQTQNEIIASFRQTLTPFKKDMLVVIAAVPNIRGAGANVPYQLVLKSDSMDNLVKASENIKNHLGKKAGVVDVKTNYETGKPQLTVQINREATNRVGTTATEIGNVLNAAFNGEFPVSRYEQNGKQYDITLRVADSERQNIETLKKLTVTSKTGERILLDSLVMFHVEPSPALINRTDRERQITVQADLQGAVLGDVVTYTETAFKELLPQGVNYRFIGFAEEMQNTAKAMGFAFLLSFVIMYLILAALFESLVQPLIIMIALPLALIGALTALFLTMKTINLFTMIGIMLLMGLVGKNAVLLIDFANQARLRGKSIDESLLEAGEKRLRPILMTTTAMVFSMLPLALGSGQGSELQSPMATTIIGGLISSMFLTLLVVPAMVKVMSPLDLWLRKWYERKPITE